MKYFFYMIILVLTFSFFVSGCTNINAPSEAETTQIKTTINSGSDIMLKGYKLIANGKNIIMEDCIEANKNNINLPFTAIMEAFGAEINWVTNSKAKIKYNGNKYILNIDTCSMFKVGRSFDLLSPPPGGIRSYQAIEHELILDSVTIKGAFQLMGTRIKIELDNTNNIISITYLNG